MHAGTASGTEGGAGCGKPPCGALPAGACDVCWQGGHFLSVLHGVPSYGVPLCRWCAIIWCAVLQTVFLCYALTKR
eukprot:1142845-Pelagomonas_calceolata.AAC.9